MKAIINVRLYDYVTMIPSGYVLFDKEIIEVGTMQDSPSLIARLGAAETIIDGEGKWLLPGLINFHTHIYSAFARGFDFKVAPHNFTEVLDDVWWRLDRHLSLKDLYWSGIAYAQESLKKGVVGIIDHNASGEIRGSTHSIEKALIDVGVHGITCFEASDRFDLEAAIEENLTMIRRTKGPFGLHASMTLSDSSLRKIASVKGAHPIHVHVSESREDQEAYAVSPIMRLNAFGLIGNDSLLVHGVHMTADDAQIAKQRGAVLAVCTRSNLNNAVGTVNYSVLKPSGLPVVAGTDGLGVDVAASWQALYYQSKLGTGDPSGVPLEFIRQAIVESYAYYERLTGYRLGRFEAGYRFDAMLVNYMPYTPVVAGNIFGHVFYGIFDEMDVSDVWVGGSHKVKEHKITRRMEIDGDIAKRLWRRIGGGAHEKI